MLEFREKRKIRKLMYSPLTMVILLLIALVLIKATLNVYQKAVESKAYLLQAQAQLEKISATQSSLHDSVASLKTTEGVEAEIRSQFLVAKPGEQVAVIVDTDSNADSNVSSSTVSTTTSPSFWQRIVDFFSL